MGGEEANAVDVIEHGFDTVAAVKLVVQVKLLPTPVQAAALAATLHACNAAAEYTSGWRSGGT